MGQDQTPISGITAKLLIKAIRGYQLVLSPMLGSNCRFYPTCSHYSIEAIDRFGAVKGSWLTAKRLLKCHPLHPGGEDPVPHQQKETN